MGPLLNGLYFQYMDGRAKRMMPPLQPPDCGEAATKAMSDNADLLSLQAPGDFLVELQLL